MPKLLRPLTAEFIGTLLFVFLGAGSVVAFVANGPTTGSIGPLGVALAHGVGMAVIVSMTMSISGGHMNPAVTLGLWLGNRFAGRLVWQYVLAQVLGAAVGAAPCAWRSGARHGSRPTWASCRGSGSRRRSPFSW